MSGNKDFPLISLFEMPFPVWRHACKTGRKNISKHLPPGQALPELAEDDYRLWYARYINHIAKNYHEFLEGIMSGFPEPTYPPEVQDMIISQKIKMSIESRQSAQGIDSAFPLFPSSSGVTVKSDPDERDIMRRDSTGKAVVIEYGHHTETGLDPKKRKIDDGYPDCKPKVSRIDEFDRRMSRESAAGSSHSQLANGSHGFMFKCEDEFKYKVKTLILYYLDKTLLEKGLIDPETKRAKIPESTMPNPYISANKLPIVSSNFDPKPQKHFSERIGIGGKFGKERPEKISDRFQRNNSESGSEHGRITERSANFRENNYHRPSDRRNSIDRNRNKRDRDRDPRNKNVEDDIPGPVVVTNPNSSCEKCRTGDECWDCC